jgi:Fe-S-cluster containining protein
LQNFRDLPEFKNWQKKSVEKTKKFARFLSRAAKNDVLKKLPGFHAEAFEKINCIDCAACCKNYSPRFRGPDIRRISKHLNMKETVFVEKYLKVDADEDYVTRTKPCPFLGSDNFCSIYSVRPTDCHRFPYTDEDVILKRQQLTLFNAQFCPAVYFVLDKLSS